MLKAGDPAPDFTLPADDGGQFTLSSLRGRNVLLWFFPEAGTPGCSLEGRGLRDHREYFDESAIEVVGVSFD
ncbi:MAG TPA: redoxin domain-containing protein, partial [Candidatus Binataceae bacterium]|nr:redoxin domain-containing protein [Candidatus Binataceae bacterium]